MENSASLIFHNANVFAATMYPLWLIMRFAICRCREYYPPWTGIKPWLRAVSAGVAWGATVWIVICYSEFLSYLLQTANFVPASLSFEKAMGSWIVFILPAVLFFGAIDSIRKIYSWIFAGWDKDRKNWHLLLLRAFACTAVIVSAGMVFILVLPVLFKALF